jgi:glycosyltransferase involved in cell wall biosynthesis
VQPVRVPPRGALTGGVGVGRSGDAGAEAAVREDDRIRVLFLIRRLELGGAERQLLALLRGLDRRRFAATLTTFGPAGPLEAEARQISGIDRVALGGGSASGAAVAWRLARLVARLRPDVVHGTLPAANLLALLAARPLGCKVVWGLRASDLDFTKYPWRTGALFRAAAWLSPLADRIVANSEAGRRFHAAQGHASGRLVVIPNGIDTARFRPDEAAGRRARAAWGIPAEAELIGLVARIDPMKGHETFLHAAARLARERPEAWFVCVGAGPEAERERLARMAAALGVTERLRWAEAREDVVAAHDALDVATSASSFGEGFSNAVGEAMACGVPCVVTDVGDSGAIVGDTGRVVPPRDPEALAAAWRELLALPREARRALGGRARARIEAEFGMDRLLERTERLLLELARPAQRPSESP